MLHRDCLAGQVGLPEPLHGPSEDNCTSKGRQIDVRGLELDLRWEESAASCRTSGTGPCASLRNTQGYNWWPVASDVCAS